MNSIQFTLLSLEGYSSYNIWWYLKYVKDCQREIKCKIHIRNTSDRRNHRSILHKSNVSVLINISKWLKWHI